MNRYLETSLLLQEQPDRLLAQKSVLHVKAFLDGFACADLLGKDIELLVPVLNGFSQFLSKKYENPWLELFERGYDDAGAFELYFKEWRDFCRSWKQAFSTTVTIQMKRVEVVHISGTLSHIKARPGMYFVYPGIGFLFSYLKGVQRSCECYAAGARVEPDIKRFEAWLCEKAGLKMPCRWDRLLLAENGFDEHAAFEKFFESLDEFRKTDGS